jgi:predicted nucleic acid-binding protein
MTDTLVDTDVILDIANEDRGWLDWSERRLAEAQDPGSVLINSNVYAEIAAGSARREALDAMVGVGFRLEQMPWDAAYGAGVAFLAYRGGTRLLPDLLIGAHAAVRGYRLLTRDGGHYRRYFPTISVVSPETHP